MTEQQQKRGRGRPPKAKTEMHFAPQPAAVQQSTPTTYTNNHYVEDDYVEDDMASILQQIHDSEIAIARDEEFARQLAEEYNQDASGATGATGATGDDMDEVMEQIRKVEAEELLKKKGHAYEKPLNLDRLMQQQDKEDEAIRNQGLQKLNLDAWHEDKMQQQDKEDDAIRNQGLEKLNLDAWHAEKIQQDLEYEEALLESQMLEIQKQESQMHHYEEIPSQTKDIENIQKEYIPQTREELRQARLKFFDKSN